MPYKLLAGESVQNCVRRVADEQIERAIGELQDEDLPKEQVIHQVRKRCKKIRGVLRLVRPTLGSRYEKENAWYRDAGRSLSAIRDASAMIETYEALCQRYAADIDGRVVAPIRRHLTVRQDRAQADNDSVRSLLREFEETMVEGRGRLMSWTLSDNGFAAVSGGLRKTYSRARRAMRFAANDPTPARFHEWRKRVKYHWHHMRLLREIWPAAMRARRDEADRLGTLLGDHHNLSLLRSLLLDEPESFAREDTVLVFGRLIDRRLKEIQTDCTPLGQRLFAEKPKRLAKRFGHYGHAWAGAVAFGDPCG